MASHLASRQNAQPTRPPQAPLFFLLALGITSLGLVAPMAAPVRAAAGDGPGAKGAQVYCFMRNNGNDHLVSWNAAYSLIKRQSASLFRTSPEHAAVMITEAVVNNPGTYPDCGRYLGDLYKRNQGGAAAAAEAAPSELRGGRAEVGSSLTRSERYN
jgi:hypothetical protein